MSEDGKAYSHLEDTLSLIRKVRLLMPRSEKTNNITNLQKVIFRVCLIGIDSEKLRLVDLKFCA